MIRHEPRGPNPWESGHCPGCGWTYDLHPLDMDGVDACRCPVPSESAQIEEMLDRHLRELKVLAHTFPETRPSRESIEVRSLEALPVAADNGSPQHPPACDHAWYAPMQSGMPSMICQLCGEVEKASTSFDPLTSRSYPSDRPNVTDRPNRE